MPRNRDDGDAMPWLHPWSLQTVTRRSSEAMEVLKGRVLVRIPNCPPIVKHGGSFVVVAHSDSCVC